MRAIEDAFGSVRDDKCFVTFREQDVAFRAHGLVECEAMAGQDALRQWIRIAKQGHPNGRCGCLRRDAALFEFSGEVCCGETVLCVSAGD